MSASLEPPASFGLMFPFKEERSRNKERLEASLAALCELELLKQRQESRVLSALCLGDEAPVRTAWTALRATEEDAPDFGVRLQTSSLQCTPWGIMASLEQHVAQLKVNAEVKLADLPTVLDDCQAPAEISLPKEADLPTEVSTFHQRLPRSLSAPNGTPDTDTWLSDLARSTLFADALAELKSLEQGQEGNQQAQKAETYIFGLIQRKALPPRPSKPRTSLAPDARAIGVVRQSSLCRKEDQHSPKQVPTQVIPEVASPVLIQSQVPERIPTVTVHNLDHERFQGSAYIDEPPPPYHHLPQNIQHQSGPYHKPKQVQMVANRSISLEYQSCRVIPTHVDSSNSEPDSPQNFQGGYSPAAPKPQQLPPPEEHLVNAEYIPAQPCRASTRAYAHHHHHHHKTSGASKPNRSTYSPERTHHHQEQQPTQSQPSRSRSNAKKCDKNGAARKQGKKASRSQSENSLQRAPERKYNTVERDGAGSGSGSRGSRGSQTKSKKQQHHSNGNYRRWQSSLELSQDEAEQPHGPTHVQVHPTSNQRDHCSKRTRKSRPTHPSYAYPAPNHHNHPHHNHSHHHSHHQHMEYQLDSRPVEDYHHGAQGESESSTSEAESPDSSSLSSDSDESGGLVWPQQLPPQLAHPPPSAAAAAPGGPLQQKAFVKIKASHALKKKILRFRTGSLKVMTTV
ncbi:dapper homolog 1-like [Boleophthalmus pectinirostris]|uniref:dapper homolog 1-like n=1 Tax=Boleophthalmus pectinirostris TaxID=150288 RepID=UPI0024317E71|nr:dapper homolog 1-like [Boleophthalmus pectinirostris]